MFVCFISLCQRMYCIYIFSQMSRKIIDSILSIYCLWMKAVRFFFVHSHCAICLDILCFASSVAILKLIQLMWEVQLWLCSIFWFLQDCLLSQVWMYRIAVNSSSFLKVYVQVRMCCSLSFNLLFFFKRMNLSRLFVILCWWYWKRVSSSAFRIHIIQRMRLSYSLHDIRPWYINFIKSCISYSIIFQSLFHWTCSQYRMQPFRIALKVLIRCIFCKQVWTHFSSIVNVIWFFIVLACMILHHILESHQDWINNWLNLQDITSHWISCKKLHFGLDFIDSIRIWFHLFRKVLADYQYLLLAIDSLCIRISLKDIKLFLQTFLFFRI